MRTEIRTFVKAEGFLLPHYNYMDETVRKRGLMSHSSVTANRNLKLDALPFAKGQEGRPNGKAQKFNVEVSTLYAQFILRDVPHFRKNL
jgi:hypothetical protein